MYGSALDMLEADQLVHAMGSTAREAHEAELAAMSTAVGIPAAMWPVQDTICRWERERRRPPAHAIESHPGATTTDSMQLMAERPRVAAVAILRPKAADARPGVGTGTSTLLLLEPAGRRMEANHNGWPDA